MIAGEDLPPQSHYEDYPQIDNGVGSIRLFLKHFATVAQNLPSRVEPPRQFTWIVGNAVEKAFQPILRKLNRVNGLRINMVALCSHYWGQKISVTGLLTGQDLLEGLYGKELGNAVILPAVMLKYGENCFLDDMTVEELSHKLNIPILPVRGVEELIETCIK